MATIDWSRIPEEELKHVISADGHTLNLCQRNGVGIIGCPVCKENYFFVNGFWQNGRMERLPDGEEAMACMRIWSEAYDGNFCPEPKAAKA